MRSSYLQFIHNSSRFHSFTPFPIRLRRVYILFNAKHGINETDAVMLRSLNDRCLASAGSRFTLQAVITKADTIPIEQVDKIIPMMRKQIFEAAPTCLPPVISSVRMKPQFGIEEMRKSIVEACELGFKPGKLQ